jgi:hypothetical protein
MERQEAIQGVRIVLTSYTASFRVPFSRDCVSSFLGPDGASPRPPAEVPVLVGMAFAAALRHRRRVFS